MAKASFTKTKQSAFAQVAKSKATAKPQQPQGVVGSSFPNRPAPHTGGQQWVPTKQPVILTPEQVKYINAGLAAKGSASSAPPTTPIAPFLTPEEMIQESEYDTNWRGQVQALTDTLNNAITQTGLDLADAQKTHDVNTAAENESAAARGLFQSSIRASDLNDIDATLTTRQNTLNTALSNLRTSTQTRLGDLATDYTTHHNAFDQEAASNAAAIPPVLPNGQTPQGPPASSSVASTPSPIAGSISDGGPYQRDPGFGHLVQNPNNPSQVVPTAGNQLGHSVTKWLPKPPGQRTIQSGGFKASNQAVKPPKGMAA